MTEENNTENIQFKDERVQFFLDRILKSYVQIQADYKKKFGMKLPQVRAVACMVYQMHRSFENRGKYHFYPDVIAEIIAMNLIDSGAYILNPDYKEEPENATNNK